MRYLLLLLAASLLMPLAAKSQYWNKIEGTVPHINNLTVTSNNKIYAAGNNAQINFDKLSVNFPYFGNGYSVSTDGGTTFTTKLAGDNDDGFSIFDIYPAPWDNNLIFAAARQLNRGFILISTDGGETWNTDEKKCDNISQVMAIASITNGDEHKLFASSINTSKGLIISTDNFTSCTVMENMDISSRDIEVSKLDGNMIFVAGDNNSQFKVQRSTDGGETWHGEVSGLEGLRVHTVLPSAFDGGLVFAGCDSISMTGGIKGKGIYRSLDSGKTWQQIALDGATVFDIDEHPDDPFHLAAACGDQGVYISGSRGYYWEPVQEGLPLESKVTEVEFKHEGTLNPAGYILYASVQGHGLYVSEPQIASVDQAASVNDLQLNSIYPQPASESISINYYTPNPGIVTVKIFDILGEEKLAVSNGFVPSGSHIISISSLGNLPNGVYFLNLLNGASSKLGQIVINR